jgi:hypothetical protein
MKRVTYHSSMTLASASPYRTFSREEWAKLRADTAMTLVPRELKQFSGLIEDLSMSEVEQIYLPLSRLLKTAALYPNRGSLSILLPGRNTRAVDESARRPREQRLPVT